MLAKQLGGQIMKNIPTENITAKTLLGVLGTVAAAAIVGVVATELTKKVIKDKPPLEPNELTNLPEDWNKYH